MTAHAGEGSERRERRLPEPDHPSFASFASLPPQQAETPEERRDRIRAGFVELAPLIAAAYKAKDHHYFGYVTWAAFVHHEFGGPLRLSRADRPRAVAELRAEGLSTRAIGEALDVAPSTVRADLAGERSRPPRDVQGADGKRYRARRATPPLEESNAALAAATDGLGVLAEARRERAEREAARSDALRQLHDCADAVVACRGLARRVRPDERDEADRLVEFLQEAVCHVR
jgi:hypothetical protein